MLISRRNYFGLLALVVMERVCELALSRRNARRAVSRGALEVGHGQYRVIVAFHALFIIGCAVEATFRDPQVPAFISRIAVIGEVGAQALRYWSVATLGERWNTRIIVDANQVPITTGPYRYVRHPNYAAVVLEIACLPLVRGLLITAVVFSALNALLLAFRIRLEERALGDTYQIVFARRPLFIPRIHGFRH
jgi:methyltransferase